VGYLDFVALRYALKVTGQVDGLAVTNLDRLDEIPAWRFCDAYQFPGDPAYAAEFFDFQGQQIHSIKIPCDPTDLSKQEALTRMLMAMQPVYSDCAKDKDTYLRLISEKLNLPIVMTSSGPTALEKSYPLQAALRMPEYIAYEHLGH
jgi:adenylosuccinate synthase